MRPKEPQLTGEGDLFRARLDQIINLKHELVQLAGKIDWNWIDSEIAPLYSDKGRPGIETRFVIGLVLLKHIYGLSDEGVCERWVYDPYFQHFTGAEFFQHAFPHERSDLSHWRKRLGDRLELLLAESLRIAAVFGTLDQERYLQPVAGFGERTLSELGSEVMQRLRESSPQDETLVFLYDRLLRKPVRLPPEELMVPAAVDPIRMIEIRPYPADGPEIEDIGLPELTQILRDASGGSKEFGRDLLRLKRIVRRVRIYRYAVALVYKKMRSAEVQIAFIVDDARHEGLEHAFAERGGPKKMGFIREIDESATLSELRRHLGPQIQPHISPDPSVLEERRIAVSLARLKYQTALSRQERAGERASPEILESVRSTAAALESAQKQLLGFPVRRLGPYEPAEILREALETASRRLLLSSRTLDRSVVDALFLKRLEELLAGGTAVSIALSEQPSDKVAGDVEKLRSRYPKLAVSVGRRGQFHYLVRDDRIAAITNRPFLSNLRKSRSFFQVVGFVIQEPKLVAAFSERVEGMRAGSERRSEPPRGGRASK